MQMSQASKASEMIFFFVFSANLDNMSFINWRLDGKETQGFYLKINLLRNGASIKDKGTNSLAMNMTKSYSNWIWWGSFLLEGIIFPKKDAMLNVVGPNFFLLTFYLPTQHPFPIQSI
jgi:hypothetical protein